MGDQNNYVDCQYNLYNADESSCNGCSVVQSGIRSSAKPTQEQLWDQTGISAGLYAMDISSLTSSSQRIQSGTNNEYFLRILRLLRVHILKTD
jgi:hypothetical protein